MKQQIIRILYQKQKLVFRNAVNTIFTFFVRISKNRSFERQRLRPRHPEQIFELQTIEPHLVMIRLRKSKPWTIFERLDGRISLEAKRNRRLITKIISYSNNFCFFKIGLFSFFSINSSYLKLLDSLFGLYR